MAYKLRDSDSITRAKQRLAGLNAIEPSGKLDLGNGYGTESLAAKIEEAENRLNDYNKSLKNLSAMKNEVDKVEQELDRLSSGVLTAVGQKYTKDSNEYEQAGGTRESKRAKPVAKSRSKTVE
ncbi:hypothetical protein EJV47_06765 [Hymenobacter gummosus]|uniref:Uncharacterized protein n=1 Tax=Hymenobacter gummosus TaxID=1776032 RepID=A0A3S0QJB8_9BACT|nr:hypothetical protein [Hymenobacter gummosus]RTQ51497.1 hypothetical protein EJV47_06765 [Hymenobacter gummosus]